MSGGNQSQGHWLTQGSVPRSVSNNNRPWEGIQSESGLMILIQAATTDKAPMLSTASRCPHCYSLLITSTEIKLILLNQFNAHVILIMLFASNLPLLPQRVWSSLCKVIALQFITGGTLWNADLIKTNAPTLFSLLGSEPLEKPMLFSSLQGILQTAIYTYIMDELLHQIKSRACCNELWGYS